MQSVPYANDINGYWVTKVSVPINIIIIIINLNSDARQRTAIGTFGHIQSAGCLGTREAVTAAHNKCLNGLMEDICKHQVKRCALRLIAEDKDKSLRSLWEDKALQRICSQKELWAAAAEGERKRHQERREQEGNEISRRRNGVKVLAPTSRQASYQ